MVEGNALKQDEEMAVRVAAAATRRLQRGHAVPARAPPARRHQADGQRACEMYDWSRMKV